MKSTFKINAFFDEKGIGIEELISTFLISVLYKK